MQTIITALLNSLLPIAVLALATLGITLIFKTSFTTNFAQGSIATLGGYAAAKLIAATGIHIVAALPLALVVGFAVAVFVDTILFRYGRHVNALGKQIITMGLVLLITSIVPVVFGTAEIRANMKFLDDIRTVQLGSIELIINMNHVLCFGIAVVVITSIFVMLKYSKWGMSVRATASNEVVAQMMGINTKVVTAVTWGIAGALAALAGIIQLSAAPLSVVYMVGAQVDAFMAGIVGGMTSFFGPVVGAAILPIVRYFLKYNEYLKDWADVILYLIILFIVLVKPNGLFGKKMVVKV